MKNNCLAALLSIAGMLLSVAACNSRKTLLRILDAAEDQPAQLDATNWGGNGGTDAVGTGNSGGAAASSGADASASVDVSADAAVSGSGDSGFALGTPRGFLIVNATANTVYVEQGDPVKCRAQDASAWQACDFFGTYCARDCLSIQPGEECCVQCEQATPTLLALPAGGSRTIAWTGSLFAMRAGYCSYCECQEQSAVGQGTYEATVRAYQQYACVWGQPCPGQPDGTIPYAAPQGSFQEHAVQFAIPSADEVVVITIPAELSVEQILANTDTLLDVQLTAVGKVFGDYRQKPDWPDPAMSMFILQDGGDVPGYTCDPPPPYIQLYSATDLSAYLEQQVRVTAYLRSVVIQYQNGQSYPFLYLEVRSITAT